jgi:hypothetical protein
MPGPRYGLYEALLDSSEHWGKRDVRFKRMDGLLGNEGKSENSYSFIDWCKASIAVNSRPKKSRCKF